MTQIKEIVTNFRVLARYSEVGTSVSYGSFRVTTPQTPSFFSRFTSDGKGTAPSNTN